LRHLLHWLLGVKPRLEPAQTERLARWRALPEIPVNTGFDASRYVVVDVETSGLNIHKDRLIAIGAVAVVNGKLAVGDSLEIVLQQHRISDKQNILIHGIGGTAQAQGVPPIDALLDFLEFVGRDPLIAFHVAFDQAMIGRAIRDHLGFRLQHAWADLAYVAPALFPELARRCRSLDHWMTHFGIGNYARHSALADAVATAELMLALKPALESRAATSFQGLRDMERERRRLTHPI
jgi:DNA polymerase III subunit epsilon